MVERAKGVLPKAHYLLVGVMLGRYVSYRSNPLGPVVTSIQTGHFLLTEKSNFINKLLVSAIWASQSWRSK